MLNILPTVEYCVAARMRDIRMTVGAKRYPIFVDNQFDFRGLAIVLLRYFTVADETLSIVYFAILSYLIMGIERFVIFLDVTFIADASSRRVGPTPDKIRIPFLLKIGP